MKVIIKIMIYLYQKRKSQNKHSIHLFINRIVQICLDYKRLILTIINIIINHHLYWDKHKQQ